MTLELSQLVGDFAAGLKTADAKRPVSKRWRPGIGPHDERRVVALVTGEMQAAEPERYAFLETEYPYPDSRERCDLCIGSPPEWAIKIKALRMLGDTGIVVQGRDEVSKILSPYPLQRSALTDSWNLAASALGRRRAILFYAYDFDDYPMLELVEAFELLARRRVDLGPRVSSKFANLVHPIHTNGAVFAWELGEIVSDS
jgi:hypothetical protein